eukprot:4895517-Alexandrium_andersonii.AAC.1
MARGRASTIGRLPMPSLPREAFSTPAAFYSAVEARASFPNCPCKCSVALLDKRGGEAALATRPIG